MSVLVSIVFICNENYSVRRLPHGARESKIFILLIFIESTVCFARGCNAELESFLQEKYQYVQECDTCVQITIILGDWC